MGPHPNTIVALAEFRQQDLLATARACQNQGSAGPNSPWRMLVLRAVASLAACLFA